MHNTMVPGLQQGWQVQIVHLISLLPHCFESKVSGLRSITTWFYNDPLPRPHSERSFGLILHDSPSRLLCALDLLLYLN